MRLFFETDYVSCVRVFGGDEYFGLLPPIHAGEKKKFNLNIYKTSMDQRTPAHLVSVARK